MKIKFYILPILFLFSSIHSSFAQTTPSNNIIVIASPKSQSSTSFQNEVSYAKTFDIMIMNTGKTDVDLEKIRLKAYDESGKAYHMDAVDEKLISGKLPSEQSLKGFVSFSDTKPAVYATQVVKISSECD